MEKKVKLCDYCYKVKEHDDNIRMAKYVCSECGKDLCDYHTEWLQFHVYYDYHGEHLKITVSSNNDHRSVCQKPICFDCSKSYISILSSLGNDKNDTVMNKLLEQIVELAKIEAI